VEAAANAAAMVVAKRMTEQGTGIVFDELPDQIDASAHQQTLFPSPFLFSQERSS
jgi:hypothetical protein